MLHRSLVFLHMLGPSGKSRPASLLRLLEGLMPSLVRNAAGRATPGLVRCKKRGA